MATSNWSTVSVCTFLFILKSSCYSIDQRRFASDLMGLLLEIIFELGQQNHCLLAQARSINFQILQTL